MMHEVVLSPVDFVALVNQTFEYAYPSIVIEGEIANFRISKNKWVYFDLKDEYASIKCFATVYQLPGPLEDGLKVQVGGTPRLHALYGFSFNTSSIMPVGEGSLRRAAALLEAKLRAGGLFDDSRKRPIPYPPETIGLITSGESAAYHDFVKILHERWGGIAVQLADIQVQGEAAPGQIVRAIEYFNTHAEPVDVLVLTRGGGSADDLAAFSTEQVTRAVAGSRIPTIVAIGHEVDISLAELAADQRASTPSNAAQMLTPDRKEMLQQLRTHKHALMQSLYTLADRQRQSLRERVHALEQSMERILSERQQSLALKSSLLGALSPKAALKRGYALIQLDGRTVRTVKDLQGGMAVDLRLHDGSVGAVVTDV